MKPAVSARCPYCSHGEHCCKAEASIYPCTRARGHEGLHVACSTDQHVIAAWDRGVTTQSGVDLKPALVGSGHVDRDQWRKPDIGDELGYAHHMRNLSDDPRDWR